MGDDEGGAALAQGVERAFDLGFGLGIERARRFVQDQDRRVFQDGAGDGDALAFAARERGAALANHELIAARLLGNEVVGFREAGGALHLRVRRVGFSDADVFADRCD